MVTQAARPGIDATADIKVTPRVVLESFFEAVLLRAWMGTVRSVTIPRVLGPYSLEWPTREEKDDVLGRLGGVLRGTVLQVESTRGFSLTDVFWLPPFGHPVGRMALEVTWRLGVAEVGRGG